MTAEGSKPDGSAKGLFREEVEHNAAHRWLGGVRRVTTLPALTVALVAGMLAMFAVVFLLVAEFPERARAVGYILKADEVASRGHLTSPGIHLGLHAPNALVVESVMLPAASSSSHASGDGLLGGGGIGVVTESTCGRPQPHQFSPAVWAIFLPSRGSGSAYSAQHALLMILNAPAAAAKYLTVNRTANFAFRSPYGSRATAERGIVQVLRSQEFSSAPLQPSSQVTRDSVHPGGANFETIVLCLPNLNADAEHNKNIKSGQQVDAVMELGKTKVWNLLWSRLLASQQGLSLGMQPQPESLRLQTALTQTDRLAASA
jgi:hypothetical protein